MQKVLTTRKYHDGRLWDEYAHQYFEMDVPEYTLIRHTPDSWSCYKIPMYSIVVKYTDGSVRSFLFDDLRLAFRTFRHMVGLEII